MALAKQIGRVTTLLRQCSKLAPVSIQAKRAYAEEAAKGPLKLTFASPTQTYYNNAEGIRQIDVPGLESEFGICTDHVPTVGVLKPGVLTVFPDEGDKSTYFVSSGTFCVNRDNTVQIMAEEAFPTTSFDPDRTREALDAARSRLGEASGDLDKVKAQVEVDCLEALQRALV